MTMKSYLMVRDSDNVIVGCMWQDDPDAGPTVPQQAPPAGVTLIDDPVAATFTRDGHSDTEVATWVGGVVTWTDTASLDQVKAAKLAELASAFSQRIAGVRAGYPEDEVKSWPEQKAEASAYAADNTAAVPLLSSMASARGITVADLASRVLANAQAWSVTSGGLIGKRQAYEDAVTAATDAAAVAAIVWTD